MKVLYTTNYPSPYRVHFFNELGKLCNLTVVFEETPEEQTHRNQDWFCKEYDFFNVVFLKNYKIGKSKQDRPHRVIAPKILKYVKKEYDFIIVGTYSTYSSMMAIFFMQRCNIPYWIETDGGLMKSGLGVKEKMKSKLISGATGYFSPSKVSDDYLKFYGANKSKIYRYPFTSLYEKDIISKPIQNEEKKIMKELLGIKHSKMILSVGQFIPRKGFDILINATKGLSKDIGIYIIGGKATKEYTNLRKKLELEDQVQFLEFKQEKVLSKYYKAADIFVLPTREDIWGLVINEAMAYGLPIITTQKCVAGLELISNENGKLVSVGNISQLHNIMQKYCNENDLSVIANKNIKKINKYTFEQMAFEHMNVLRRHKEGV